MPGILGTFDTGGRRRIPGSRCGRSCPVGGQNRPSWRTSAVRSRRYAHQVGTSAPREPEMQHGYVNPGRIDLTDSAPVAGTARAGARTRAARRRAARTRAPQRRSAPVAAGAGDTSGTIVPRSHYWRRGHGLTSADTLARHRSTRSRCSRCYGGPGWVCSTAGTAATSPSPSGRTVVACRCPSRTSAWSTCPSSVYFAPSSSVLSAYSYSLPAPGGRLDAGTSADDASPNDQNPRRQARVF